MINIYLLISLSFLAGSVITGLILWGKLRGAIDKSIRLETESNLRINIKEELKKEKYEGQNVYMNEALDKAIEYAKTA